MAIVELVLGCLCVGRRCADKQSDRGQRDQLTAKRPRGLHKSLVETGKSNTINLPGIEAEGAADGRVIDID